MLMPVTQDCQRCNQQPKLNCDMDEGRHMWEVSHRCPDGIVTRGARGHGRSEVIKEWNRQQIAGEEKHEE